MQANRGHVFVSRGDLTRVWCDAWLMPSDATFSPREHWYLAITGNAERPPESHADPAFDRVRRITDWPTATPAPWLVDVGGGRNAPAAWFVAGVTQWLEACARDIAERRVTDRARPLLALPLVGTGLGGAAGRSGDVVRALLPVLYEGAERHGVDIALITHEGPAHAAALESRRKLQDPRTWPEALTPELRQRARRLAEHGRRGNLVLFLGAGVSMGAGVPSWNDLLAQLAEEVGIGSGSEGSEAANWEAFGRLSPPDRARLISRRLPDGGRTIGALAADFVGRFQHYSISHLLLAGLPVRGAVTTNYDQLYERASADVGDPVSILPYEPSAAMRSWLLKLHGCVTRPDDIVLTRADFLRYDQRRAALRGVVQAMLLTRHMLFVGFSMNDDNFQRVVDDVRQAVRGDTAPLPSEVQDELLATTLSIESDPYFDALWSDEIFRVSLHVGGAAESARLLEIFLDYVGAESLTITGHLMDERWAALLDPAEQEVRVALEALIDTLSPDAKRTEAWKFIEMWLQRLGRNAADDPASPS